MHHHHRVKISRKFCRTVFREWVFLILLETRGIALAPSPIKTYMLLLVRTHLGDLCKK